MRLLQRRGTISSWKEKLQPRKAATSTQHRNPGGSQAQEPGHTASGASATEGQEQELDNSGSGTGSDHGSGRNFGGGGAGQDDDDDLHLGELFDAQGSHSGTDSEGEQEGQQQQHQEDQQHQQHTEGEQQQMANPPLTPEELEAAVEKARKHFKHDGLGISTKLYPEQAQYLVRIVGAAVSDIAAKHPGATVKELLTVLQRSHGLMKHSQANYWLTQALKDDGMYQVMDTSAISTSLAEAVGARGTKQQGERMLANLKRLAGEDIHQLAERYQRHLADYHRVPENKLTNDQLMGNLYQFANALGPPLDGHIEGLRLNKFTFAQIIKSLDEGEKGGSLFYTGATRGGSANNMEEEETSATTMDGLVNAMAEMTTTMATALKKQSERTAELAKALGQGWGDKQQSEGKRSGKPSGQMDGRRGRSFRGRSFQRKKLDRDQCAFCEQHGHWQDDCRKKKEWLAKNNGDSDSYSNSRQGHRSRSPSVSYGRSEREDRSPSPAPSDRGFDRGNGRAPTPHPY